MGVSLYVWVMLKMCMQCIRSTKPWVETTKGLGHRDVCVMQGVLLTQRVNVTIVKVNVKEVDIYSAFIVVPHTQGAQDHTVFTCKLHRTCLYLVSVHQMAPPQTEVADI